MTRTLDAMIGGLPLDQQREIEARAAELIQEEMTLSGLRKARERTQKRVAEALHISQDAVSRIEARSDFLLSTLGAYVEALGGKLRLVAEFPHRRPVIISGSKASAGNKRCGGAAAARQVRSQAHHGPHPNLATGAQAGRRDDVRAARSPSPRLRGEAGVRGGAIFRRVRLLYGIYMYY
jgi:Helix-turn-helix domain